MAPYISCIIMLYIRAFVFTHAFWLKIYSSQKGDSCWSWLVIILQFNIINFHLNLIIGVTYGHPQHPQKGPQKGTVSSSLLLHLLAILQGHPGRVHVCAHHDFTAKDHLGVASGGTRTFEALRPVGCSNENNIQNTWQMAELFLVHSHLPLRWT